MSDTASVPPHRHAWWLLLVALVLVMSACSSDDEGSQETTAASPEAPTETAPAEEPAAGDDTTDAPPETDTPAEATAVLAGDGLALTDGAGATTPLPFGVSQDEVQTAIETALGPAMVEPSLPDCGNGSERFVTWGDQLRVEIIGGEFVGWYAGSTSMLTTVEGVGPGSTLPELEFSNMVEVLDTTLGAEFQPLDDASLSGLLDGPMGTVTDTWAGSICIFR